MNVVRRRAQQQEPVGIASAHANSSAGLLVNDELPPMQWERTTSQIQEDQQPGAYARAPGMASVRMDADAAAAALEEEILVEQDIDPPSRMDSVSSRSSESEESSKAPVVEAFLVGGSFCIASLCTWQLVDLVCWMNKLVQDF